MLASFSGEIPQVTEAKRILNLAKPTSKARILMENSLSHAGDLLNLLTDPPIIQKGNLTKIDMTPIRLFEAAVSLTLIAAGVTIWKRLKR